MAPSLRSRRPRRSRPPGSVRSAPSQNGHDRQGEDAQVTADRDVLDVVALDRKTLVEPEGATPVNLHRPGQSRFNGEAEALLRCVSLDDLDLFRTRSNETHLGAHDVDELRQLVEARAAQQAPDRGDARIVA